MADRPKAIAWAWSVCRANPEAAPLPDELTRWPVPASARDDLIAIAGDTRRDARERAVVGRLVTDRELAGWKPVELAKFFLQTGQFERLRALDDVGAVLARLHESGRGDTIVRQLADGREWSLLWELATRLPLTDAVSVAHLVAGRWQPPEAAARQLFDLLSQADPTALGVPAPVRLRTEAAPRSCSFSADGRWVALTVLSSAQNVTFARTASGRDLAAGADLTVDWLLFEMPAGKLIERTRRAGVLYDARLADRWENRRHRPAVVVDGRVFGLHGPAGKQSYPAIAEQVIMPYPGGFVREDVILPGSGVPPPYQGGLPHDGVLTLFDSTGNPLRSVRFHEDLGLPDRWHYGLTAVDQQSGRVLVNSGERVWLLDPQAGGVLASTPPDTFVEDAAFLDPDRLAMISSAPGGVAGPYLRIWRVRGDKLKIETDSPQRLSLYLMAAFRDQNLIVCIDNDGRARWYDARTLAETPARSPDIRGPLWDSPDGRLLACVAPDDTGVDVFVDPTGMALAGRAVADLGPVDLAAVSAALRPPASHGEPGT